MGTGKANLAVLLMALAISTPNARAQAVAASAAPNGVTIRVCNATEKSAALALIYRDAQTRAWRSGGWYDLAASACENFAETDNLVFYGFAEEAGNIDYFWGGDFPQCVRRPGPFEETLPPTGGPCAENQDMVRFVRLRATGEGVFTWTLEP